MHPLGTHGLQRLAATRPVLGTPYAPTTVLYFGDLLCPRCQRFEGGGAFPSTGPQDLLRLLFLAHPDEGHGSWPAAEASHFVWNAAPATYWAWHRQLVQRLAVEGPEWATRGNLVRFSARFAGVDGDALARALRWRTWEDDVRHDLALGREFGVRATPAFVLDGDLVDADRLAGAWTAGATAARV